MDRKLIVWSLVLFFGCSIAFRAIDDAAAGSARGVSVAIQAAVAVAVVVVVVVIMRRRR